MIPVDFQRVHHFSATEFAGMMNHVYLQELQSGPSHVASSTHSVLGVSNTITRFLYNHNKGLHITMLPCFSSPATLCLSSFIY